MDVFDGRCAMLELEYEERNTGNILIAIAELVETRKLSSWMSKRMTTLSTRRCVWTSRDIQRQHNVNDPQLEKLVEEIVEVVQIISQKHH